MPALLDARHALHHPPNNGEFVSSTVWRQDHEHTLVVACSDPRFCEARGELLNSRYRLRRYDPLFVPGGPLAVLTSTPYYFLFHDMVTLLHSAHAFERVVGISHSDCRAYRERYPGLSDDARRERQIKDLEAFAVEIRRLTGGAAVDAYYSEPLDGRIRFIRIV